MGKEGSGGVRHAGAVGEGEELEVRASGGEYREPGVGHNLAAGEVEVLEVGASGGDRREPAVRHAGSRRG